jgi:hypothetical protein
VDDAQIRQASLPSTPLAQPILSVHQAGVKEHLQRVVMGHANH